MASWRAQSSGVRHVAGRCGFVVFSVECQEGSAVWGRGGAPLAGAGPEEASPPLSLPAPPSLWASPGAPAPAVCFPGRPSRRVGGPGVAGWPELPGRADADVGPARACQDHAHQLSGQGQAEGPRQSHGHDAAWLGNTRQGSRCPGLEGHVEDEQRHQFSSQEPLAQSGCLACRGQRCRDQRPATPGTGHPAGQAWAVGGEAALGRGRSWVSLLPVQVEKSPTLQRPPWPPYKIETVVRAPSWEAAVWSHGTMCLRCWPAPEGRRLEMPPPATCIIVTNTQNNVPSLPTSCLAASTTKNTFKISSQLCLECGIYLATVSK